MAFHCVAVDDIMGAGDVGFGIARNRGAKRIARNRGAKLRTLLDCSVCLNTGLPTVGPMFIPPTGSFLPYLMPPNLFGIRRERRD
jgi:hypothetical protein